MKSFLEWVEAKHPEYQVDEGVLDVLGRSKLVKGAVTAAGLAAGAIRGMPHSSAAGFPVAPGVVRYDGSEGMKEVERATRDANLSAERGLLDVEQRMLVQKGPENWMVTNPKAAPDWYKPYLYKWYRDQISKIERTRGNVKSDVRSDMSWIEKAIGGDTTELPHHTAMVDGREVQIDEPLKNPDKLLTSVSDNYRRNLIRFYSEKIDDIGEEAGLKAYRMGIVKQQP